MMGFEDDIDTEIVKAVTDDYKKAESWLPFKATDIKSVFTPDELKVAESFMEEMKKAANENERITILADNVNKYGKVVVKLLKIAKVII